MSSLYPPTGWTRGGTYEVSQLPIVGAIYVIEGKRYKYTGGGHFWEATNNPYSQDHLVIHFIVNPFLGVYSEAKGVPMPVWASAREAATTTIMASSMHVDQKRICRVGTFHEANTTLEVRLLDEDNVPFIDPNVVPLVVQRAQQSADNVDRVGAYSSDVPYWTDLGVGQRAISEMLNRVMVSYSMRLEKEPVPHWVVSVSYYTNGAAAQNKTIITDFVGQLSGLHGSTSREVGVSGTPGHYKVELLFGQQGYLSSGSLAIENQRIAGREGVVAAAGAFTVLWLTVGGTSGGANIFDSTFPPTAWILGHQTLATTPASEADWKPSSRGMGFVNISGTLSNGTSIQDVSGNLFQYESRVERSGGKWRVNIFNDAATTRHFAYFVLGKSP